MMKLRSHLLIAVFLAATVVGCNLTSNSSNSREPTPTPASYFDGAITLDLVAPSEVREYERVIGLDIIMTNTGQMPFTFYYSGNLLDFEAVDDKGETIWKFLNFWVLPLGQFTLLSGESKTLSEMSWSTQGQWDLRDLWGSPADPSEYKIKGVVTLSLQDPEPDTTWERLETSARTLTIKEAPLPEYAKAIKLELTAPFEARVGEPVSMDMHIANTGGDPVELRPRTIGGISRPNHMEVIVFKDGKPIWQATTAYGVQYIRPIVLDAGDSRDVSSLSYTHTPWEWDQAANCGESFKFKPCDKPVEPGTYTVRGYVNISPAGASEQITIATKPQELVIKP